MTLLRHHAKSCPIPLDCFFAQASLSLRVVDIFHSFTAVDLELFCLLSTFHLPLDRYLVTPLQPTIDFIPPPSSCVI